MIKRRRAQAIIVRDNKMLFAYGYLKSKGESRYHFVGGGIEEGESDEEAVLRELKEETGVCGKIIFRFTKELKNHHATFLIDIGEAECSLGYDPEDKDVPVEKRGLQALKWIDLSKERRFNDYDRAYFRLILDQCEEMKMNFEWLKYLTIILEG